MIALIRSNCGFLQQGIELLEKHDSESFARADDKALSSGIGPHLRHVLDHYRSFLKGVDTGVIDYDDRVRNTVVERDIEAAKRALGAIMADLLELEAVEDRSVRVMVSSSSEDKGSDVSMSSLVRELQFLASHTVHHYALIAVISRMSGVEPDSSFGVAPSTLKYLQTLGS